MCKRGYKQLIIDTQNMPQKLELKLLISEIQPFYEQLEEQDTVNKLDIVVFYVENNGLNTPEMLKEEAGQANIQIVPKPVNSAEVKAIFTATPPDSAALQGTQITRSNTKTSATVVETTVEQ